MERALCPATSCPVFVADNLWSSSYSLSLSRSLLVLVEQWSYLSLLELLLVEVLRALLSILLLLRRESSRQRYYS